MISGSLRVTDTIFSTNLNLSSLTASQAVVTDENKNLISRGIRNNTTTGALGWTAAATDITLVTTNTIAYWNGAYSGTTSNLKILGTVTTGTWNATTIGVGYGGTGTKTAPTQGGIIFGSSTSAYGCTGAGTSGQLLQSAGTGTPTWITATNSNTVSTIVKRDASGNFSAGTITASLSGNATTSTSAKYLMNRGGDTVTIADSPWTMQTTPSGHTNRATVFKQQWTQSGLTYTPSGGSATAVGDTADFALWLSSSDTANILQVNMQLDGLIYALGGFIGNVTGNVTGTATYANNIYRYSTLTKGTNPSSTTWMSSWFNYQTGTATNIADRIAGGIESYVDANGLSSLCLRAYRFASGSSDTNTFEIRCAKDGTCTYSVSNAANFRSAIGVGASGTHADSYFVQRTGDTMSGNLFVTTASGDHYIEVKSDATGVRVELDNSGGTDHGLWSSGYWSGSAYTASSKWMITRNSSGTVIVNGDCTGSSGSCTGNAATASKMGAAASWLYFNNSNEVNFGGTYSSNALIYFGYRATDSRAKPTDYYFGSGEGTANLHCNRILAVSTTDAAGNAANAVALIVGGTQTTTHIEMDSNEIIAKANGTSKASLWFNDSAEVTADGKVRNAVWNDYAEYRQTDTINPGYCVATQEDGVMHITNSRMYPGARIVSDTFGHAIGMSDTAKTPIAVAGRVLVYPYQNRNNYHIGDCVCATYDGKVDIMTREEIKEYPDRIIGIVDEIPSYEYWEQSYTFYKTKEEIKSQIKVNGRIWIYVK